ncbi:exopolyphosphatase [Corynebacterium yudongzhengii]|uniref:Bifunctional oligoribonuclease/PAP phosphatase NrnA n=1 Tax=Corynebacterium yudongzhengii TaxID=2080740 RepID=A0A2U1T572_9CORY|nr:bifunctional oligoribonuclease/PAP phosphatase NrnA [Corynebacterium yudongzhengii]AWB81721.1 exopolyphosphatase [Corynebacterium yudongzhengii]PWC01154.1 bifunctional oligoribonuclease/PAP phosphatase NrnA [Corynebacterium yudongzhengii]
MIGSYQACAELLEEADYISIVTHLRPDADAIGSTVALGRALELIGKKVTMHVGQNHPVPRTFLTIPGADRVREAHELPTDQDLIVTVDCGSLDRTGAISGYLHSRLDDLLVIDHHASNTGFGSTNLIDHTESTTVILRDLIELLGVRLDKPMAHALYAGLMTDTGSFRWGSPRMHELAAELMEHGLDTRQIAVDLLDATSTADVQMIGRVLSGLQVRETGNHRAAILIADVETISGHSHAAVEALIDFVRALEGTDIGAVFKEQVPGRWAVSLRSSSLDVSQIAVRQGGGGHVPAAGYTTFGTREKIVSEFLDVLGETP